MIIIIYNNYTNNNTRVNYDKISLRNEMEIKEIILSILSPPSVSATQTTSQSVLFLFCYV